MGVIKFMARGFWREPDTGFWALELKGKEQRCWVIAQNEISPVSLTGALSQIGGEKINKTGEKSKREGCIINQSKDSETREVRL